MAKDSVRRVDYWYATVSDVPGAGHALLQRLADANVDLHAFLAFPLSGGKGQIDLFPKDAKALERAAATGGIALSQKKQALFVEGSDRPGALAEHLARLSAKGVNVTASTAIATSGGGYGFLIFVKGDRIDEAAKALGA
jgi:hypothetical protein